MTVSTTTNKVTYSGNGSTTSFSFSFPGIDDSNILVFITDSLGNITQLSPSLYTVTLNNPISPNPTSVGGTVVYPLSGSPLAVGSTITILRQLPLTQATSLTNQSIIYPPVIEQTFDYTTLLAQQDSELANRAFQVPVSDPAPVPVPAVAQRANQTAIWDSSGNLTAGLSAGGTPISAAMQPVVNSATLALARLNMGVSPNCVSLTSNYTVAAADDRTMFVVSGSPFTFTVPAPAGFAGNFMISVTNIGTRGINMAISGFGNFYLLPSLTTIIFRIPGGLWAFTTPPRWRSTAPINVFVDPVNGLDSNDGLGSGAGGALQTINKAVSFVQTFTDGPFTIQLADGTHGISSTISIAAPTIGSNNGVVIVGNNSTPGNCVITDNVASQVLFSVVNNGVLTISGFQMNGPNNGVGFAIDSGGMVNINNNFVCGTFGGLGKFAFVSNNGTLNLATSYHIAGTAVMQYHIQAYNGGVVKYNVGTLTIDGSITVTILVLAQVASQIASAGVVSVVNPGLVTGKQYEADSNSVITWGGTTPPGTIAGTVSSGGVFF